MMRKFLIFFLTLIVSICATSQNISNITITSEQLRTTNLIFAEHKKLVETVPLLEAQISNLQEINKSWEHTDSIRKLQFLYCDKVIKEKEEYKEGLEKSLKRKQKVIRYGAAGSCMLILLCLLLK